MHLGPCRFQESRFFVTVVSRMIKVSMTFAVIPAQARIQWFIGYIPAKRE